MDTVSSFRKRNRASATLTPSRLQLLLHRNRSGQHRFDLVPTHDEHYSLNFQFHQTNCKKPRRDLDELPRLLTKDLRARRVYSPPQSTNYSLIEGAFPRGAADDSDLRISREARSFDLENSKSLRESSKLQDCRGKNDGDCSEKNDGLDGSPVPTTLPDGELCVSSTSKVYIDVAELTFKDTPSTRKDKTKNGSSLKSKTVLRPRFHGKLFKAPGSVNYRRLFPFLRDTMIDDSGTPKLGFSQNNEDGGQEFQLPLSSQNQEASKAVHKTDSCTMREDKNMSESKVDATVDYGVNVVGSDLPNDGFNQLPSHRNNIDCAEPSHRSACTSQELGFLNEERTLTTPPDAVFYDNSEVNVKPMDFTRSTQGNAGERFCLKDDQGKDFLKSKYVPRQGLHRKLFKTPGSVSYKRLLPFLMDLTKDDSVPSKLDHQSHHQEEKTDMNPKRFQLPLSSQSEEASIDGPKADCSPMHARVEANGVGNYVLVYPSNELSHVNQPKLTPSQDLPEFPMQLDSNEVVGEGLYAPSANEHIGKIVKDECLSASELNPCSVTKDDFHSAKEVANVAHNEDLQEVQNKVSKQDNSESPPEDQNRLYVKGDISELTFVHHSNKEKVFTIDYDENKQFVNLEERQSVNIFPQEGLSLSQLDPNVLDVDENVTSLKRVSNDIHRSLSEKVISGKSDVARHTGDKAGSVQNAIVLYSRMPSEDSDNKNASENENKSESKITSKQVLKSCLQFKLLKRAGSLNCKRLLPFLLSNMKNNSCNSDTQHQISVFQSSHDSFDVIQLQDEQVVLNGLCKPEGSTDPSISAQEIELPIIATIIKEVITKEEKPTPPLSKSSVFSDVKGNGSPLISSSEKPPEIQNCCRGLSQMKVIGDPAVGFKKGILKRNPRGCRGLCTCLNCASFRHHAERAFEFSKNQLLDAEEVAHDLMKELSHLRNMLERSANNGNMNQVFDESRVKEACRKASAAEEHAKDRLNQMHNDLNIHSRITSLQAPRVTFAVEEKITQLGG